MKQNLNLFKYKSSYRYNLVNRVFGFTILLGILLSSFHSFSRTLDTDVENYIKENIGVTNHQILGVDQNQYARCIKAINYLDEDQVLKSVVIDEVEFKDDGEGYDLEANDGILTSSVLFEYGTISFLEVGEYRILENVLIADRLFKHEKKAIEQNEEAQRPKIKISMDCDVNWVGCGHSGATCGACQLGWWPNGCVVLSNCHTEISIEW